MGMIGFNLRRAKLAREKAKAEGKTVEEVTETVAESTAPEAEVLESNETEETAPTTKRGGRGRKKADE